ncbi:MAG: hypothetical protein FIA92_17325 [Chloroflexi bacterium]|nr:hypothetical protein [Chloroflexota bacterium]
MSGRDRILVAVLAVALVALSSVAIGQAIEPQGQALEPTADVPVARGYVEGVLGRATRANPFGAWTPADRALVALLFRGLVRLGPGDTLLPDLAARWEPRDDGRTWLFHLRPDQRWEDGEPITAEDVAFTVSVLSDPDYTGPGGESWRDVTAEVIDPLTVALRLSVPLGDFPQAATQPIAPVHVLGGVPPAELPDSEFGSFPVTSGPFRLASLDAVRAQLVATGVIEPNTPGGGGRPATTPAPTDSFRTPAPTARPDAAIPYLPSIELRWYDDVEILRRDWERGLLDGVSGLSPADAKAFAAAPDARLVRYPGTTLLAVVLDLRASTSQFLDPKVRTAMLAAIDRDALVAGPLAGLGVRADSLIPPSSPVFDSAASPRIAYAPDDARAGLSDAGWKEGEGSWTPKGADDPIMIDVLCPEASANPVAYAFGAGVTEAWRAIGLAARLVPLPAAELLGQRLATGEFQVAVVPLGLGLDPDLYPLLAASQTRSGGSNVAGLQDPELDKLLEAARMSLQPEDRAAAYKALQERLAANAYMLPLAFRDEYLVLRDSVSGPARRAIGGSWERYWDVLTWRLADGR